MANKVVEIQQDIKHKAEDYRDFLDDLKVWEEGIRKKDQAVKKKNKIEADYPPVRGTVDEAAVLKMQEQKQKDDPILRQKEIGNELFKKGKYAEAAKHYKKGIDFDPDDENVHLLYANRAMAMLKLENWEDAESDATHCVQHCRTFAKGFFRRALARRNTPDKLKDAVADLNTVLVLEPDNKEAKSLVTQLQGEVKKIAKAAEEAAKKAVPRKKLAIEEVDDSDEDDDEDEVDIPIKRAPPKANVPQAKVAPQPKQQVPEVSGVEVLDDDTEERGRSLKMDTQTEPVAPPAKAAAPTPSTPAPAASTAPQKAASPKKTLVPREAAMAAAAESKNESTLEMPRTYLQLERVWETLKGVEAKARYLRLIPTEKYGEFFRSNISEDILGDVVEVAHDVFAKGGSEDSARAFGIVRALSRLDRLSALLMFLDASAAEKLEALPSILRSSADASDFNAVERVLKKRLAE